MTDCFSQQMLKIFPFAIQDCIEYYRPIYLFNSAFNKSQKLFLFLIIFCLPIYFARFQNYIFCGSLLLWIDLQNLLFFLPPSMLWTNYYFYKHIMLEKLEYLNSTYTLPDRAFHMTDVSWWNIFDNFLGSLDKKGGRRFHLSSIFCLIKDETWFGSPFYV
jgi:hypothetical protein